MQTISTAHTAGETMALLRITRGIANHFHIRLTEWAMLWPCFLMGAVLIFQDDMFSLSPSFSTLAQWYSEDAWAMIVLACAAIRMVALIVNGTFDGFKYSPHMRATASLVSLFFWSQFCLGFLVAWVTGVGALSAVAAYSTFILLEVINFARSTRDIAENIKKSRAE